MSLRIHVEEGARIFRHSLDRKFSGHKRFRGTAAEICGQIVKKCWNGTYLMTSIGHFCQFYSRDFGFCTESLINLGYRKEVIKTVEFALSNFSRNRGVAVAITPGGSPFDFPFYAIDSLAFLIRSLRLANSPETVVRYREFIDSEVSRLFSLAIDRRTGLVTEKRFFSSIKDYAKRKCSCYDNVMIGMLCQDLKTLRIENPFSEFNYRKLIRDNFWNGSYFEDELEGSGYVSGDSNIFPYSSGLFSSSGMIRKSADSICSAGLDFPFPLKYANARASQRMIAYELFVRGWQKDAVWSNLGPIFMRVIWNARKSDASEYMEMYRKVIEAHGNYIEVFDRDGKPFNTPFYHADEGMLWASMFLDLELKAL
ncbi:hypothetical protein HYU11_03160 [Candidatus Woesearchaeota archaeon]|nr:hypothetical protein [Candidatus Woesearchaeota archaeon]